MKIRQASRYIENSENPIITALGIKFLEASTDKVKAVARANNKTYTSLRAASNEGMSYKKLKPAIDGATYDTLYRTYRKRGVFKRLKRSCEMNEEVVGGHIM